MVLLHTHDFKSPQHVLVIGMMTLTVRKMRVRKVKGHVLLKQTAVQKFGHICLTVEGEVLPITLQLAEAEDGLWDLT